MRMTPKQLTRALAGMVALFFATMVVAPPAFAQATLNVSQTEGLSDGTVVTISGSGFAPGLKGIAIGQCIEGMTGPSECNTQGGATFKDADANGNIAEFTLVVKEKFGPYDCTTQQCVFGAQPLPGAVDEATVKANTVYYNLSFGEVAAEEPPAAAPAPAPADPSPGGGDELPKTGPGEELLMATAGGVLLIGLGVFGLWMLPRRSQGGVA